MQFFAVAGVYGLVVVHSQWSIEKQNFLTCW